MEKKTHIYAQSMYKYIPNSFSDHSPFSMVNETVWNICNLSTRYYTRVILKTFQSHSTMSAGCDIISEHTQTHTHIDIKLEVHS